MPEAAPVVSRIEFTQLVRDALNRLYDSGYLENHPLSRLLIPPISQKFRPSQELRRILLTTIQSMHPGNTAPKDSRDWRVYRILELRYITGLTASEVMRRLSLGRSLFFLEQARALDTLVDRLWAQAQVAPGGAGAPPKGSLTGAVQAARPPQGSAEVDRLLETTDWETIDLGELLEKLRPVISALIQSQAGEFNNEFQGGKAIGHANSVLLRQVILGLISHGLEKAPKGRVSILNSACAEPGLIIRVSPTGEATPQTGADLRQGMSLELCARCLQAMQGTLLVENQPDGSWQAHLTWPVAGPRRLLVIDDHPDFIELVRRYLAGLDWQVLGAGDADSARQIIACNRLDVILLDVILPKEDGWELLLGLKTEPATRRIPVVVCSALNEPGLVAALGGAAFLPKPLTRPALLAALAKVGQVDPSLESGNPGSPRAPG